MNLFSKANGRLPWLVFLLLLPGNWAGGASVDYGFAVVERFRNNTDYYVNIEGAKTIHDLLPSETVIRIKSYKPEYGKEGRYYAVRKSKEGYFLTADATDPTDASTELIVQHYLDSKMNDWLGFSSLKANKQLLRANSKQAVQFSEKAFADEGQSSAHWKILGSTLARCVLQNRLTTGCLSARNKTDARDLQAEVGAKKLTETAHIIDAGSRDKLEKQGYQLSYGDTIRIVHGDTFKQLCGDTIRYSHEGGSGGAIVFANGKPDANTWIIKGPHNSEDRFNCAVGTPVKNNDTIRLEHALTGKNLHCAQNPAPHVDGGTKELFEISLFGSDGIGDDNDNFLISVTQGQGASAETSAQAGQMAKLSNEEIKKQVQSGSSKQSSAKAEEEKKVVHVGQLFLLSNVATQAPVFSANELFALSGGMGVEDERAIWKIELTTGTPKAGDPIRYRDRIRLTNTVSGNSLIIQGDQVVAAYAETVTDQSCWRIKGPHKENDRWNAENDQVMTGATIRLESSGTGNNLFSDNRRDGPLSKQADGFFFVGQQSLGGPGIGSTDDDWQITLLGAGTVLTHGARVVLEHVGNRGRGASSQLCAQARELSKGVQEVITKRFTPQPVVAAGERYQRVAGLDPNGAGRKELNDQLTKLQSDDNKKLDEAIKIAVEKAGVGKSGDAKAAAEQAATEQAEKSFKPNPEIAEVRKKMSGETNNCTWFVEAFQPALLPTADVAWTGVPNGSPAEDGANEAIGIEIVRLGAGSGIAPHMTIDLNFSLNQKPPTFYGFASDSVTGFDEGYLLKLGKLLSQGAAWIEQSLARAGRASVSFSARAEDKGDVQVLFGTTIGTDYVWKVIIGANNNTEAQIVRREIASGTPHDVVVARMHKDVNALAAASPGNFVPYWTSINDGEILLGTGTVVGENILLAWTDPQPRTQPTRIGFATNESGVEFTGVQVGNPVGLKDPQRAYAAVDSVSATETPAWLEDPLRVPGRGTISFSVKGEESATLLLASSDAEHNHRYAITFTNDEQGTGWDGRITLSVWDPKTHTYVERASSGGIDNQKNALKKQEARPFWISFANGRFFVGRGEIGSEICFYYWDPTPLDDLLSIGVASGHGSALFSDLIIAAPMQVALLTPEKNYADGYAGLTTVKGNINVISPYRYKLMQEGQSVKFVDLINNVTYYPGKVPEQGALYYFMMTLDKDGTPDLIWSRQPENPEKISRQKAAYVVKQAGLALTMASSYTGGAGEIGGMVGAVLSAAMAGAGYGIMSAGIDLEAAATFDYRQQIKIEKAGSTASLATKPHSTYVYMDEKKYTPELVGAQIPAEAQRNRTKIEQQIALGSQWQPSSQAQLERLIALYTQAIMLIVHPYVVRNTFIKQSIFDRLAIIYQSYQELHAGGTTVDGSTSSLLNLLMTAYSNTYLTSPLSSDEQQLRNNWLGWISALARAIMASRQGGQMTVNPCYGEYIWLTEKLPAPGKGLITFEAKATNDIMLCVAPQAQDMRGTDREIYEISIGSNDNSATVIRARNLDKAAAFTEDKDALASSLTWQQFWVSIDDGVVVVGKGDPAEEKILVQWHDPYPIKNVRAIGISSWNVPVTFKNISVTEL